MLILRPTRKLADRLRMGPLAAEVAPSNVHADWHVRMVTVHRLRYLLFTHSTTLFSFVVPQRGVTNADALVRIFLESIERYLASLHQQDVFETAVLPASSEVTFAGSASRAVLGSTNDLAFQAEGYMEGGDLPLFEVNDRLNSAPMGWIEMNHPARAFAALRFRGRG